MGDIFGLFGVTDYDLARRMTLKEYRLRFRGYLLAFLDKEYFAHLGAFLGLQVQSTNGKGELVYQRFKDFYDKEERQHDVLGQGITETKNKRLLQIARNVRAYQKMKGEEDDS